MPKRNLLKGTSLTGDDVREGLSAIVSEINIPIHLFHPKQKINWLVVK